MTKFLRTVEAYFAGDIKGGYRLECQGCFHVDDYTTDDWTCVNCGVEMVYPSGASW